MTSVADSYIDSAREELMKAQNVILARGSEDATLPFDRATIACAMAQIAQAEILSEILMLLRAKTV